MFDVSLLLYAIYQLEASYSNAELWENDQSFQKCEVSIGKNVKSNQLLENWII